VLAKSRDDSLGEGTDVIEQKGRVLVVDDEERVRHLIAAVLKRKGYETVEAAHGKMALELLRMHPVDLIITDLRMPEMDGLALLEVCRERHEQVGIILLTAYGTIQSAVQAMKRGASDYITKPFNISDLEAKVEHWFEQRRTELEMRARSPIQPLVELMRILAGQGSLPETLQSIVDLVQRTFAPQGIEVVFYDHERDDQVMMQSGTRLCDLGYSALSHAEMRRVAGGARPWLLRDAGSDKGARQNSGAAITVPMLNGQEVVGAFTIASSGSSIKYQHTDAQLLQILVSQAAVSILHNRARQRLLESFHDRDNATTATVQALLAALEAFDQYTHDHCERVAYYAHKLGQRLGLSEPLLESLRIGGLFHDIGKLGVGDGALHKNDGLTSDEFDRVKLHPVMGAKILAGIEAFTEIVPLVLYHHERQDGTGYPEQLSGEAIPLGARIIAVADIYDSMVSDRPYRLALTKGEALQYLQECAGTHLDRGLVQEWCQIVRSEA
jgi:putative nucleotidyltransferase with HDIG domain